MKTKMILIVAVGFAIFACSNGRDSTSNDEISGAYGREYSFKVVNPESGNEIGMRTIRDTIFIRPAENGYEVSNRKWKLNDYDKEGWQDMEHSDDRPLSTYNATFDPTDNSLNAELMVPLYLNSKDGALFIGKSMENSYYQLNSKKSTVGPTE